MPRKEVQMFRAFTDAGTAPSLARDHATLPRVCTPRSRGRGGMKGADISPIKGADDSRRYVRRGGPGPLSESTLRRRRRRKGTAVIHPKKQGPRMLAVIKAACRAPVIQTACCFVFPLWLPVYIFMPASVEEDCVLISSERERKGKKK